MSLKFVVRRISAALRWGLHLLFYGVPHETCRAPLWLVGIELVGQDVKCGTSCKTMGIQVPVPFVGVAWIKAHQRESSNSLLLQESLIGPHSVRVSSKIPSRVSHVPWARTAVIYRIIDVLPLCLNSNEPQRCHTGDRVRSRC